MDKLETYKYYGELPNVMEVNVGYHRNEGGYFIEVTPMHRTFNEKGYPTAKSLGKDVKYITVKTAKRFSNKTWEELKNNLDSIIDTALFDHPYLHQYLLKPLD